MKNEEILYAKSPLNNKVYKLVPPQKTNSSMAILTCTIADFEDSYLVNVEVFSMYAQLLNDSFRIQISKNEYEQLRLALLKKKPVL